MTQFLQFDKLTTGTASHKQPILVNRSSILLIEEDVLEDKLYRTTFTASRVHIIGYPEYTFHTLSSMDTIASLLRTVDATQGVSSTGSSCGGTPGILDVLSLEGSLPIIKLNRIKNRVAASTVPYLCNPNYLLYAEETPFQDEETEQEIQYLTMVFRGNPIRRIPTKLDISELATLLTPIIVP
jgi:hypothetical protein